MTFTRLPPVSSAPDTSTPDVQPPLCCVAGGVKGFVAAAGVSSCAAFSVSPPQDVDRPTLSLIVDATDVFPEDAEADHLNTTEKQNDYDQRGISRQIHAS